MTKKKSRFYGAILIREVTENGIVLYEEVIESVTLQKARKESRELQTCYGSEMHLVDENSGTLLDAFNSSGEWCARNPKNLLRSKALGNSLKKCYT